MEGSRGGSVWVGDMVNMELIRDTEIMGVTGIMAETGLIEANH